jgi:frataxin-like iron-binding protein CyaY
MTRRALGLVRVGGRIPMALCSPAPAPAYLARQVTLKIYIASHAAPITTLSKAPLTEAQYHPLADEYLDHLSEKLDTLGDQVALQLPDYDVMLSMGVLTLKLGGEAGTYVLNKQPPNVQIWMASPVRCVCVMRHGMRMHAIAA